MHFPCIYVFHVADGGRLSFPGRQPVRTRGLKLRMLGLFPANLDLISRQHRVPWPSRTPGGSFFLGVDFGHATWSLSM